MKKKVTSSKLVHNYVPPLRKWQDRFFLLAFVRNFIFLTLLIFVIPIAFYVSKRLWDEHICWFWFINYALLV